MKTKPVPRDEEALPRHPHLGAYLAANPVDGVTVVDRADGLGPRAVDWPDGIPAPDVEAWVAEQQAKRSEEQAAAQSRQAKRAELSSKIEAVRTKATTANTGALLVALAEHLGLG